MTNNVVIIGAGRIGSAIGKVLNESGASVELWDKDTSLVAGQKPLSETVPSANFIFLCVPSFAVREVVSEISPLLARDTMIVSLAKSIEDETRKTMDDVLADALPKKQPFAILAGPLLAEDLETGEGGAAVAGSYDKTTLRKIVELFASTEIIVETTNDVRGAALCGVLKNIYAMALGVADGLGWGDNMKGWLAGRAMREMISAAELLGGKRETVCGSAGFGDFIATGFSKHSGHRGFGEKIASGADCAKDREGCKALPSVILLLGKHAKNFPLLLALNNIVTNDSDPKIELESL